MDNLGPGTVNASEITIKWPYELASRYHHGKHLLYLMQPPGEYRVNGSILVKEWTT